MRLQFASVLLLAGTVVGCASNPPPPPPMPEPAPMPAPAPMAMAPTAGTYRGMADLSAPAKGCRAPKGMQTARVRGMTITVAGQRGTIGADGTVSGRNVSGMVNGGTADLTIMRGKCSYHYTMNNADTSNTPGTSGLPQ